MSGNGTELARVATRRRGFTIIEVFIACVILAMAIVGTLMALGVGGSLRQTSRETMTVSQMLTERAERFRGIGFSTVPTTLSATVTTVAGYAVASGGTEGDFTFSEGPLSGARVQTVILDEASMATAFADRDGDGTAGESPDDQFDLDNDGTAGETGLTSAGGGSDVSDYQVMPITVTVTWRTASNGAQQTRSTTAVLYQE
jgi:type II secretory pathway pseudopilin PulG